MRLTLPFVLAAALALPGALPTPGAAQTAPAATAQADAQLPMWQYTSINDFAQVLTPEDTRILDEALIALHEQTGIEGTVVTLTDRARYGGTDGLEHFATRLFNHWGVGDAQRNDGFMVLLLRNDREARIELGRAYSEGAGLRAGDIMSRVMVPAFKREDYSAGLREGTLAVIDQIARPTAAGQVVTRPRDDGNAITGVIFALALAGMGAMIWRDRRRRRICPQCGHVGLTTETGQPIREELSGGGWLTKARTRTRRCPNCGWENTTMIPLPTISYYNSHGQFERSTPTSGFRSGGRSSGGFGGGSSRGGGASGRW